MIAFVGSVFSPYYAWARARGSADPEDHCGLNVALYGRRGHRWALTERRRRSVERSPDRLRLGPSAMAWDGETLVVRIDETTVPWPSRLRGTVRLAPLGLNGHMEVLDARGRHRWWPVAPCARIEADFQHPPLRWLGHGYLDSNAGDEPIEEGFVAWDWSRASHGGTTTILYDAQRRDGSDLTLALHVDGTGRVEPFAAPPRAALPATLWRVARRTRSDPAHAARLLATLEDTPFYARSLIATAVRGAAVTAIHESLSLERFAAPWVRLLLPFRMPRELP